MEDIQIRDERARTFAEGLHKLDQDGDAAAFARQFADDALTQRFDARGERTGEVEQFWTEYRSQFHDLSTRFYNAVEGGDEFALEWVSEGTLTDDRPITYRGVTAFGYEGDKIVWLRTYYDSAAFTLIPAGQAS
jgi:hypothetical protein